MPQELFGLILVFVVLSASFENLACADTGDRNTVFNSDRAVDQHPMDAAVAAAGMDIVGVCVELVVFHNGDVGIPALAQQSVITKTQSLSSVICQIADRFLHSSQAEIAHQFKATHHSAAAAGMTAAHAFGIKALVAVI